MNIARLDRMGLSDLNYVYVRNLLKMAREYHSTLAKYRGGPGVTEADQFLMSPYTGIHSNLNDYFDILHLKHLGVDVPGFDIHSTLSRIVDLTAEYFIGDWRDNAEVYGEMLDRAGCRQETNWVDRFRSGLLVSLLADNQTVLRSVCGYVRPDLPPDDGAWNRVEDDRQVLFYLADVLPQFVASGQLRLDYDSSSFRRKRAKGMIQSLESLPKHDEKSFVKGVNIVVDDFLKSDFKGPPFPRVPVSWDGSILYRLAEIAWPKVPPIPEETTDYLLTRESLRLN